MGTWALQHVQLAQQSAFGTPNTVATIIPTGFTGVLEDTSTYKLTGVDDMNGMLVPEGRIVRQTQTGKITITGDLTFENAPYILNAAIKAVATPASTGTTGKLYNFPSPTTAVQVPTFFTIQGGDDTQAFQLQDCACTDWEIAAAIGGETTFKATFEGHSMAPITFTASVPRLAGVSIPAWLWKMYIEEPAGTFGTSLISGMLINWTLKQTTGYHLKQFQQGTIAPTNWGVKKLVTTFDYKFEQTAAAITERAKWLTDPQPLRKIRMEAVGAVIGAGPATKKITIDQVLRYMGWKPPTDNNGNTTIDANGTLIYDSVDTTYLLIAVVNALAALT